MEKNRNPFQDLISMALNEEENVRVKKEEFDEMYADLVIEADAILHETAIIVVRSGNEWRLIQ